MSANTVNTTANTTANTKPDFGSGRYSSVMAEAYSDALRLTGMDKATAEKFARDLGSDLGRALAKSPVSVGYGKANKDGKMTLKEASSVKGIYATRPITLARLLSLANDLAKQAKPLCDVQVSFEIERFDDDTGPSDFFSGEAKEAN